MPFPDKLSPALRGGVTHLDGRVTYGLKGEIDMSGAEALRKHATDAAALTPGDLVLDLAEVTFIDSSGVRVLVQLHEQARAEGRSLLLRGVQDEVRRLLDLVGVTELLTIEDSREG